MSTIGYARVSSVGQKLDVQLDKLNQAGCDKVFSEKKSGKGQPRPELTACLEYLREGDVLIITKLDRLARSTVHLHKIVDDLNERGVGFRVLDQTFDTTTKEGRLLFGMLALVSEFETDLRAERQVDGIASAKDKGVKFGRPKALTPDTIAAIKVDRETMKIKDVMAKYNLSKATVYRALG